MSFPTRIPFDLGPWRVEPLRHRLTRSDMASDHSKHITPKTMEVLLYLVGHAGQVVRRDALLEAIWPETHISEEVVTRAISDLRSALEDDRRAPRFIETIPKVGYRLIVPVSSIKTVSAIKASQPILSPSPDEVGSMAVSAGRPSTGSPAGSSVWRGWIPALVGAVLATALVGFGMNLNRGRNLPSAPAASALVTPILAVAVPIEASPVTDLPGFESFAEMSPDSRHVAYSWRESGKNSDVYVLAVDASIAGARASVSGRKEPRRVTNDPAADLGATWSPDGLRLAFGRYRDAERVEDRCTVLEVPVAGGPERRLGSCGRNGTADFAWSPSGEWIAFSDRREGDITFGIYLLSTLTGESHLLVAPDDQHWGDRGPSFSPDGSQVVFTRSVSMATQDVFRIPVTGGEPVRVTRDGRSLRGHAWLPDGSALVVSSRRTGTRGLWRFPIGGGSPSWLPVAVDHAWNPTMGRTPGPLLFEYRVLEVGIQQLALTNQRNAASQSPLSTPWLVSTREDLDPRHSPDGRRVAFVSNRSGHFEIWTASADGADPVQLTAMHGAYTGSPQWSPDGRSLVFDARQGGQADVYRVELNGTPERLTDHPANDLAPSFSTDGRWIHFGSNRTGEWQIWRRPSGGGEPAQLTADGGYRALASGDTLFFTRFDQPGLFRLPLGGGGEPVAGTEHLLGHDHWTLVGETLYWFAATGGQVRLERLRATGERDRLADLGSPNLMSGLSITADENAMLYAELTRLEADLWRVDAETFLVRPQP